MSSSDSSIISIFRAINKEKGKTKLPIAKGEKISKLMDYDDFIECFESMETAKAVFRDEDQDEKLSVIQIVYIYNYLKANPPQIKEEVDECDDDDDDNDDDEEDNLQQQQSIDDDIKSNNDDDDDEDNNDDNNDDIVRFGSLMENREIITINIGGCGINLGKTLNEQYCVESGISFNGEKEYKTQYDPALPISFEQRKTGKYLVRNLMIDMDPYTINNMKNEYKYIDLFNNQYLISGKHDGENNFAVGHMTEGKQIIDKINDTIRICTEKCDKLQGFIINHSLSGGCGGGLGSLILNKINDDYQKQNSITFQIFHDENKLSHPAQVYNSLLTTNCILDHSSISIIMDNKQIDHLCRDKLNIQTPRYQHYNHLLIKLISSITASSRYGLNETLDSMRNDLILYPRLHFMTPSMSPITTSIKATNDIRTLLSDSLNYKNFFISAPDYDVNQDKMMKLKVNYRGNKIKDDLITANKTMTAMANKQYIPSTKWIDGNIPKIPLDDVSNIEKQVTMIANNTWISRLFTERITERYDILWRQRAYVHLFIEKGMDEAEFYEARENLKVLEQEYVDALSNKPTINKSHESDDSDDSSD